MKITLKTLSKATAQEVFDQVAEHLLKQNVRATHTETDVCAYRGENNTMCAAGCLVADDEYDPAWEGMGWADVSPRYTGRDEHLELISQLQQVHDFYAPDDWVVKLKRVAANFKLNTDAITENCS